MKIFRSWVGFTIIICVSNAFGLTGLSKNDRGSIRSIETKFAKSWIKKDEKGVLGLFWDNAALYPNGRAAVSGINEIRRVWFGNISPTTKLTKYDTTLDEIKGDGKIAYAIGRNEISWTSSTESKTRRFEAVRHFVAIYEKRNGKWKILRRHWNGKLKEIE